MLSDSLVPTDANVRIARHSANVNGVPTRIRMISSRFASDYIGGQLRHRIGYCEASIMRTVKDPGANLDLLINNRLASISLCVLQYSLLEGNSHQILLSEMSLSGIEVLIEKLLPKILGR